MKIAELMADPTARMTCMSHDGLGLEPVPLDLTKYSSRILTPEVPLEFFGLESHGNVVQAFRSGRRSGYGMEIALRADNGEPCRVDVFDRVDQYGCMVVIMSSTERTFVSRTTERMTVPVRRCVTKIDAARRMLWVDDDYQAMFGYAPEEVLGHATTIIHPDDIDRGNRSFAEVLEGPGAESRTRLRVQHKNGSWIWLELTRTNLLDTEDPHIRTVALDVSSEMAAHRELERQSELLHRLANSMSNAVLHVDCSGKVEFANDRWTDLTGTSPQRDVEDFFLATFQRPIAVVEQLRAARTTQTDVSLIVGFTSPMLGERKGRLVQHVLEAPSAIDPRCSLLITLEDVTESLTVKQEVAKLERIDQQTKLLNELGMSEQVRTMLFETTDYELPLQLLFLDLIDFPAIEGQLGIQASDAVIHETAQCLRQSVQPQDLVARVNTHQFVVVLRGIAPEHAARAAGRIQTQLATTLGVVASLGRSTANPDDAYESMLDRAKASMTKHYVPVRTF